MPVHSIHAGLSCPAPCGRVQIRSRRICPVPIGLEQTGINRNGIKQDGLVWLFATSAPVSEYPPTLIKRHPQEPRMHRPPAVAGLFYPAHPTELRQLLEKYLQAAATEAKPPKALIVPHAGYAYSGPAAASAYARLKPAHATITRVLLIGPSHRVGFQGLAVSAADAFVTPLGAIEIDKAAIDKLCGLPFVVYLEAAHSHEHSLEVQLPFLQVLLDDFKLVPVVAGEATPAQVEQVLDCLWGGPETLIVISSDLSHYHDYLTAKTRDQATSTLIEQLQYEQLSAAAACGKVPVSGLLKWAKAQSLSIKTVDLRNSGDTAGDHSRVVGYGAYVIE